MLRTPTVRSVAFPFHPNGWSLLITEREGRELREPRTPRAPCFWKCPTCPELKAPGGSPESIRWYRKLARSTVTNEPLACCTGWFQDAVGSASRMRFVNEILNILVQSSDRAKEQKRRTVSLS